MLKRSPPITFNVLFFKNIIMVPDCVCGKAHFFYFNLKKPTISKTTPSKAIKASFFEFSSSKALISRLQELSICSKCASSSRRASFVVSDTHSLGKDFSNAVSVFLAFSISLLVNDAPEHEHSSNKHPKNKHLISLPYGLKTLFPLLGL